MRQPDCFIVNDGIVRFVYLAQRGTLFSGESSKAIPFRRCVATLLLSCEQCRVFARSSLTPCTSKPGARFSRLVSWLASRYLAISLSHVPQCSLGINKFDHGPIARRGGIINSIMYALLRRLAIVPADTQQSWR